MCFFRSKILLAILLAFVFSEICFRFIFYAEYEFHPTLGVIFKPNSEVRWGLEGYGVSHWLANGERSNPFSIGDHNPVVVFGDSFTEGVMVNDDEVFTAISQKFLNDINVTVSIKNVGRAGNSVADYITQAPILKRIFNPSWTVIEVMESDWASDAWSPGKNHFYVDGQGSLEIRQVQIMAHTGWVKSVTDFFKHSMLLQYFFYSRLPELKDSLNREKPLFRATEEIRAADERNLPIEKEIERLVQAYDRRLTILFISEFPLQTSFSSSGSVESRLSKYCRQHQVSFINSRSTYQDFEASGRSPFGFANSYFNGGHLNRYGHAAVGKLLAIEIERIIRDGIF